MVFRRQSSTENVFAMVNRKELEVALGCSMNWVLLVWRDCALLKQVVVVHFFGKETM